MKNDIYQEVTDRIVSLMESEPGKFTMPFKSLHSMPYNFTTGNNYNGINVLMLAFFGGGDTAFASYKQWQEKGYQVKKGEKGKQIIFFKMLEKENKDGTKDNIPLIRYSVVFGASQLESPPVIESGKVNLVQAIKNADEYVKATGATIQTGTGGAYYMPSRDYINMPPQSDFIETDTSTATENYYSTLLHELTHWTGHKSRLDRLEDKSREGYAFEELIAELGASFQCCELGITSEPRKDHAQYLASWLKALKDDKRFIFKAASRAQKAVEYIKGLQGIQKAA